MSTSRASHIVTTVSPILLAMAYAWTPVASAQPVDPGFTIVGVNVIPMDEERILEDQTVIVVDNRIQTIGDSASTDIPTGLTRIDGNGGFLVPGFADLHTHLRHTDELVNYLAWGVTTIMHLGGSGLTGPDILELRQQIDERTLLGPNIYTTNRVFDGDPALPREALQLASPDVARQEVRNLKAGGFDFIKIYNNVSQPVFEAIVDEARKHGLPIFGHIPRSFDPITALSGGQDAVAHTEELFFTFFKGPRSTADMRRDYQADLSKIPQLIEVLVENNVAIMPDLSFTFTDMIMWDDLALLWNDPEYRFLHPASAAEWQAANINRRSEIENFIVREQWKYELIQKLTFRFQQAGVLQVVGTDASIPGLFPGKALHRELTELIKAGLSNFDTLSIGTRNAGEFVRRYIDDSIRLGQIKPGYRADLVLLDENPLADVRNARQVSAIAVNGRWIDRSELDERRSAFSTRYKTMNDVSAQVDLSLASGNASAAMQQIIATYENDAEMTSMIETRLNAAGYAAGFAGDLDRALFILKLNTQLFPDSANTWDSLAEITLYLGERDEAIVFYQKALEVDPDFKNAQQQIEKLLDSAEE